MKNIFQHKKWQINFKSLFIIGIVFLTIISCDKTPIESIGERQDRIDAAVIEKLEERRKLKKSACKKNALVLAEKKVDSILLAEAKLITIDTINKPPVPIKPSAPEILIPKDSTPVKPLFEDVPDKQ